MGRAVVRRNSMLVSFAGRKCSGDTRTASLGMLKSPMTSVVRLGILYSLDMSVEVKRALNISTCSRDKYVVPQSRKVIRGISTKAAPDGKIIRARNEEKLDQSSRNPVAGSGIAISTLTLTVWTQAHRPGCLKQFFVNISFPFVTVTRSAGSQIVTSRYKNGRLIK